MKKFIKDFLNKIKESRYLKPILFFILLFICASFLMVFFESQQNNEFFDFMDGFWWAIITFSTTGYGDKVPITLGGRVVAIITIFLGIGGVSLLTSSLASWLVDRNSKARRGLMDYKNVSNHLVICGWKQDMKDILLDIIKVSDDFSPEDIVIVSNIEAERIQTLQDSEGLKGLKYVRGDYFSEDALERANVKDAKKVLILADSLESNAASEVDSKTVMTVLTIRGMAKDVYLTAEVLDIKYESYLKQAMCDEILLSQDFARRILASTSATNGMSHIILELLSRSQGTTRLITKPIKSKDIGKAYSEIDFSNTNMSITLGILENTGSPNQIKMEALREAQKTSDVSKLIQNLQEVKKIEVNRPVFLPSQDYVVQPHSQLIVLERL